MSRRVRRRQRKQPHTLQVFLIIVLVLLTVCVLVKAFFLKAPEQKAAELPAQSAASDTDSQQSPEEQAAQEALRSHLERKGRFYTILLSGSDDGNGNSDTNILVAIDTVNGYIYGTSIARDTKAVWNGKNHKINAAFGSGGMEKMAEVVSDQLGIPVDYTVSVDLKGFAALVDAIGGVDFDVPVNMDYEDPYQDLYIHISKGMHHLSGSEALKVVRFRKGYATQDIGRMETQQKFLKAVAKQTLTVSNLGKIDEFVKIFQKYVKTDLTLGDLAWLGKEAISIGADNIEFSTLPGVWNDHDKFIHLNKDDVLTLVNEHLNPYVEDRTADDLNIPD